MTPIVRYGQSALADVLPSVLTALGVPGERDTFGLAPVRRAVVVLVDGLGAHGLRRCRTSAPFLSDMDESSLTAGFPATTVTSLTSLGTGLPPGEHGLTGYSSYVDEVGAVVNWLGWRRVGDGVDLRPELSPETAQPRRTAFERAAAAGVEASIVSASNLERSALTMAALRGGHYVGTVAPGDVAARAAETVAAAERSLVYAYVSELDVVGHVRGPDTESWCAQLRMVDAFVQELCERLPARTLLLVTADHGMATVPESGKVDYDASTDLQEGVRALAREARARYVHAEPGALDDVTATWTDRLRDRMWVVGRDDAIENGWFGPIVTDVARSRIGDLVFVAHTPTALVRRRVEARSAALRGHHGALTDDELLVPLLRRTT